MDTVGGAIEQWGRRRGASVLAVLSVVVAVKLAVAVVPLVVDRLPDEIRRWARAAACVAAAVLVAYGGLRWTRDRASPRARTARAR